MSKKILIPVTNHATLGSTDEANGTYAPELTHALHVMLEAGFEYDIASIEGGKAPMYGTDAEGDDVNTQILANDDFQNRINNTIPVSQINIEDYDAVFYPGGFGHYESGGVLAAVCHGPAALLPITLSNGEKLLANKSVTGFTREEEIDFGTIENIPFLLEEALARTALRYNKVQPWVELVIEDDRVITGQNPTSAHAVGNAIVKQLA